MGTARLAIYLVGLVAVVVAAWILLTMTPVNEFVSPGLALALILLIVGIGIMASAKSINDARVSRRVVHDTDAGAYPRTGTVYEDGTVRSERVVEERRWD